MVLSLSQNPSFDSRALTLTHHYLPDHQTLLTVYLELVQILDPKIIQMSTMHCQILTFTPATKFTHNATVGVNTTSQIV